MKQIKLTQGMVALVDDADFEWLNQWKWYGHKKKAGRNKKRTCYARRAEYIDGKLKAIMMHRLILGLTDRNIHCDHKDGNGLNNQRFNLRKATSSQNQANRSSLPGSSSKFFGVHWDKFARKWKTQIKKNHVVKNLGRFDDEKLAAIAYNKAAIITHGDFARLNTF